MARSSSGRSNRTVSNGATGSGQVGRTVGQTHGHPVRAVSYPVIPTLPQYAITLAPPEVAPVTWSDSALPFKSLASRSKIDVALGTMSYHNPKTVSYDRTPTFNHEGKIREQLPGTRRVALPPKKVSPSTLVKDGLWANQWVDILCASVPATTMQLTRSSLS
ncbi:hypothetical protein L873DRAFT_311290 [Choiromyces venosus 120613-1]|uniref:Uncharacterized protein n=1 Tax=Choiromyces venosus 120613-1 TaxID=1336337 RepID=A0A3N4IZ40_9PEZI|nr:hypothetical protein L873DRAFT_311290 [Choiromyces venosus 120613-1]